MPKIELRYQRVSDAKRFFEILNNPNFKYFPAKPKDLSSEVEHLRKNADKIKNNQEYNYTILYERKLIGGCGIKIDSHREYIGEIGYFIDEKYWGKGITPKAVKLLEQIGFNKLKLKRIAIIMDINNHASEKVAINCGYKKEGLMRKCGQRGNKFYDEYLYAKVKS